MRISCSFWYIVVSLLVLLASCDDSKKVDKLIEKEKQEAREREEERKKREEEEKKREEEYAKSKVLEGVYSGKRTSGENGQSQIDEVFNVTIGYSKEDKKWYVAFSSVNFDGTASLITQEEDKLIFYVEWRDDERGTRYHSATFLFTPSSKKLKITKTCSDSYNNWTYEGTKQ